MIYENYYRVIPEDELLDLLICKKEYLEITLENTQSPMDFNYTKNFNPQKELKKYKRIGNE